MKSGFVAILGKTNTGKSTFLNTLLDKKISITSPKKQTTRTNINGIYNSDDYQIVFVDTPGIHKATTGLGTTMNKMAIRSSKEVEAILHFVDLKQMFDDSDIKIIRTFKDREAPVFLVLTKLDQLTHKEMIEGITRWNENFKYDEIIPISSLKNDNIDKLLELIKKNLKEGPQYYEKDQTTDAGDKFQVAELIREKALFLLRDEVPHALGISVLEFIEEDGKLDIFADLIVERDSQKGIVIGKQASMIKKIKLQARRDIQNYFGKKTKLELNVRVEKDWRKKEKYFNLAGIQK